MEKMCEGRVCIVTGAGRGIGREHALLLARHGAKVVVNDLGGSVDGSGGDDTRRPVGVRRDHRRRRRGGRQLRRRVDWEGAQRLVNQAIETFGDLHVVINNAGILRDRVLVNMTEDEWDAVIAVHLKGTFAPSRWAAAYWREKAKAGEQLDNRIINTSSVSGIYGNPGQTNYGAAKAGIAAFTQIAARELVRYGVTVNAIAPGALTRMTEGLAGMAQDTEEERRDAAPPLGRPGGGLAGVAPVEGRHRAGVRGVRPGAGHRRGLAPGADRRGRSTTPTEIDGVLRDLLAKARPNADMSGQDKEDW